MAKKKTNSETIKKIALHKVNNPDQTHAEIAEIFNVKSHVVRYAVDKYSESIQLMKSNRKGVYEQTKFIAGSYQDIELLKRQLNFCAAQLENDQNMAIANRVDMLYKIMRIRMFLQSVELESHIKRVDADIIGRIVRRFQPEATNDDIIKIYQEEYVKWANQAPDNMKV